MKIVVNVKSLKDLLPFDYLEVFQLDSFGPPITFTEHRVPADAALPRGMPYELVSRLVNMRFARAPQRKHAVYMPKTELPRNWNFDVITVGISGKKVPIMLVFYCRELSGLHIDAHGRIWAVAVEEQIAQRMSGAVPPYDEGGISRIPEGQEPNRSSRMVRLDTTTFEQFVFLRRSRGQADR